MINDENMIKDKAKIYFERHISVHITKGDGEWLNGFIDDISDEFLMIEEFKKDLMPVFFKEITSIETYTKEVTEE